jgi:hypothetical protein
VIIEMKLPLEVFAELLRPLDSACVAMFEWLDAEKKKLKPTKEAKTYDLYKYVINKPSLLDKIWCLEAHEITTTKKDGTVAGTRRGHGCARLHLSAAAELRGELTDLVAQVTGTTVIELKVPKEERAMPTFKLITKVSTLDKNGHILWGASFDDKTAASMLNQMRFHLKHMVDSPEYPTLSTMVPALTNLSQAVRADARAPAPRQLGE